MKITLEQVLEHRGCYSEAKIMELAKNRRSISLQAVLKFDIPDQDKVWFSMQVVTPAQRKAILELIVTRAVTNHCLHCGIKAVEAWAVKWLSGEDRSYAAARAAASAAYAADADAAYFAAAAARAAAADADAAYFASAAANAYAAANAANAANAAAANAANANAAANAAAADAYAAERKLQVADIAEVIK